MMCRQLKTRPISGTDNDRCCSIKRSLQSDDCDKSETGYARHDACDDDPAGSQGGKEKDKEKKIRKENLRDD